MRRLCEEELLMAPLENLERLARFMGLGVPSKGSMTLRRYALTRSIQREEKRLAKEEHRHVRSARRAVG
jgi:hypothetical protein